MTVQVNAVGSDSAQESQTSVLPALQIQYYVSLLQMQSDSVWRASGYVPKSDFRLPRYMFRFLLPESLAGERLQFHITFDRPGFGSLRESRELEIVLPCSSADTDRMRDSYLLMATKAADFERVVSFADSLMTIGWRSRYGLMKAYQAAHRLGRYDAALRYLDACFQAHGAVGYPNREDESDSARNRMQFERYRAETEKLNNEQQH